VRHNKLPRPKPLTPQQEKFCGSYVLEGNGKSAAIEAGYAPKYARQQAYKLLQQPHIACRVEELQAVLRDEHKATAENVVERYRRMSMFDPLRLLVRDEETGHYRSKRPDELTEEERGMIADVTVKTTRDEATGEIVQTFSYKPVNAKDALDSLARTFGMFRDKVEHEHSHKVQALFEFVARAPEKSETVAMLDKRHGRGRTIEGEARVVQPEPADR
jgi:phage terminase small subunit